MPMELSVFMTEHETFDVERDGPESLLWHVTGLFFNVDPVNDMQKDVNLTMTPHMMNNGP